MMAHDLLVEPLLSWRDCQQETSKATLAGVLAHLSSGKLQDFPRVRPHQYHPWLMFLTQLAATALQKAGQSLPPRIEAEWRELLLGLTTGAHEPWALCVADLRKPAFFQSPVPSGTINEWKSVSHPDDLDILVTSKAHDVKMSTIHGDDIEAWVYALTTLQTMQGYPGKGYNGIARMNGGYGNRPRLGLSPSQLPASRFARDLQVLGDCWAKLLARGFSDAGVRLVWTEPWDGKTALGMSQLAPHFIEVCWRTRLSEQGNALLCKYTTTDVRRCALEDEHGDVGDPWIPVERAKGALSVSGRGFDYRLLTRLLFEGDFEPAAAQVVSPKDCDPLLLIGSAMARGQGKTEGLHERVVPIVAKVRLLLGKPDTRAMVGKRAAIRVETADLMRKKVLYPALCALSAGSATLTDNLDVEVDRRFFEHLFATLDLTDDEARLQWERELADLAWAELQRAIERVGASEMRRLKAISAAESLFNGCLHKQFSELNNRNSANQGEVS